MASTWGILNRKSSPARYSQSFHEDHLMFPKQQNNILRKITRTQLAEFWIIYYDDSYRVTFGA